MPRTRKQIIKQKQNKYLINNGLIKMNNVINALKSHNIYIYKYHIMITTKYLCYILKNEHIQLSITSSTTTDKLVKQVNMQTLKNSDNSICNIYIYIYIYIYMLCIFR